MAIGSSRSTLVDPGRRALLSPLPEPCQNPLAPLESHVGPALVRDVWCGACACTPSTRPQLRAGGGKLSLASLVALAPAPHSAVGADGGAPAVHADAPDSAVLADGGAPAAHDP